MTDFNIEVENISYSYPHSQEKAIDGISFRLAEGQKIALVGPSGGGKSTLAQLLARFRDPQEGCIRIGGVDIRDYAPETLMEHVAFVFQQTGLFKSSIRENLLLGNPDASQEQIWAALEAARAKELVEKLPEGLDTKIGTEGVYLSGGEQQRISLARAFLKDAPILLLDEATAYADPENEREIRKALETLMRGRTVLMIAHRLNTVKGMDKILLIHEGRIQESGTQEELLSHNSLYAHMWNEYQASVSWKLAKTKQS